MEELTKERFEKAWESNRPEALAPFVDAAGKMLRKILQNKSGIYPNPKTIDGAINEGICDAYQNRAEYDPEKANFLTFLVNKCRKYATREVRDGHAYASINCRFPQGEMDSEGFDDVDAIDNLVLRSPQNDIPDSPDIALVKADAEEAKSDAYQKVLRCIDKLSPNKRRAIQVAFGIGLTEEEKIRLKDIASRPGMRNGVATFLAEDLKISEANARQILSRALCDVREMANSSYGLNSFTFNRMTSIGFMVDEEKITEDDINQLSLSELLDVISRLL